MLFRQIIFYALLIGALSGLVLTAVQFWQVIPIIQSAERFEVAATETPAPAAGHSGHDHSEEAWAPEDGMERTTYTLLSNMMTAAGLAMLILAAMVATLRVNAKTQLDWRYGLLWGGAGYAVFYLAPAIGLPPEIPLAAAAPIEARQLWWILAVLCTAAGLAGLAFGKSPWRWAAPGLLVVPHLVGAPHPPGPLFADQVPAVAAELERLAQQFFGATAIANGALWLILGLASAWAVRRIALQLETDSPPEMVSSSD